MDQRKKFLKIFISIILLVFLISMALTAVMYLGGKAQDQIDGSGNVLTGTDITGTDITGTVTDSTTVTTGDVATGDVQTGTTE